MTRDSSQTHISGANNEALQVRRREQQLERKLGPSNGLSVAGAGIGTIGGVGTGGGGGFPSGYGVGQGDVFPPTGSGIDLAGGQTKTGAASGGGKVEDMLKKYWWILLLAAGGYYMYNKNKKTN